MKTISSIPVVFLSQVLCAATLHVPADYPDVQAAIDVAKDGDEVLVASGEYVITRPISYKGLQITLRSVAGSEQTTIRMSDTPDDPNRASVVVFESGEGPGAILQGFTITGGQGTILGGLQSGGGINIVGSAVSIIGCVIVGNRAQTCGGGIAGQANHNGSRTAALELRDCEVRQNCADGGGGLDISGAARIENTVITGNAQSGARFGGGPVELNNCKIVGNVGLLGAGLIFDQVQVVVRNCVIVGNLSRMVIDPMVTGRGGGIFIVGSPHPARDIVLLNCIISQNSAETSRGGGGIAFGISISNPNTLNLQNCIVWGNLGGDLYGMARPPMVNYSCVGDYRCIGCEGPLPGKGNLNVDPVFIQPGTFDFTSFLTTDLSCSYPFPDFVVDPGDYHLDPSSPLIDKGTAKGAPSTDIEGNARPCGQGVDIGAYEYGNCPPPSVHFVRGDADADGLLAISDAVFTLNYLFRTGSEPPCRKAADTDDDGELNLTDPVALLQYLFIGGSPPPAPTTCGEDPTSDALTCDSYPSCA